VAIGASQQMLSMSWQAVRGVKYVLTEKLARVMLTKIDKGRCVQGLCGF